jgi:hypothetical protein
MNVKDFKELLLEPSEPVDAKGLKEPVDAKGLKEPSEPSALKEPLSPVIAEAMENTTSDALAPTALEKQILELSLQGIAVATIAYKVGVPESYIRNYIRNPKVKEYLKEVKVAMNELDQLMLSSTLRKMVGERIEKIEEDEDASYADLSRRDTLDIIRVFSDITTNIAKSQKEEKETSVFANIYQQIIQHS